MEGLGEDLLCVTYADAAGGATSAFVPAAEPGPRTPLFLVPALALDGRSFAPLAPLASDRRVVFWNPPNALPAAPGLDALAEATLEHADRAGMPLRFVLGGSSLGALVALAVAIAAPDRIAGLVLTGGVARWPDLGLPMRIARFLHPFVPRRVYHRVLPHLLAPGNAAAGPVTGALHRQMRRRTKEYVAAVIAALTGAGRFDLSPRLGLVRAPTLVLHSTGDRIAPFRATRTLAAIPRSRVVAFDGGAHLPYLSEPERFLAAMREFLAEVDREEGA